MRHPAPHRRTWLPVLLMTQSFLIEQRIMNNEYPMSMYKYVNLGKISVHPRNLCPCALGNGYPRLKFERMIHPYFAKRTQSRCTSG
jgi:hypothetical protein